MARNRNGKDRRGRHRAGKVVSDRGGEPIAPAVGPAPDAAGKLGLDTRLRESVSTAPLAAVPSAPPADRQPDPAAVIPFPGPPAAPAPAGAPTRAAVAQPSPDGTPEPARAPRFGIAPSPAPAGHPAAAAIGATLIAYVQDESVAVLSHLRALGAARSPTEAIHLQIGEMQRAADATLTCWSRLARDAGRLMSLR